MKKYTAQCILIWLLSGSSSFAASSFYFLDGNQLYNVCSSADLKERALCEGYLMAVNDAIYSGYLEQHFSLCFDKLVGPTQIRLSVIKFMEQNPDLLNFIGEGIIAKYLQTVYACAE